MFQSGANHGWKKYTWILRGAYLPLYIWKGKKQRAEAGSESPWCQQYVAHDSISISSLVSFRIPLVHDGICTATQDSIHNTIWMSHLTSWGYVHYGVSLTNMSRQPWWHVYNIAHDIHVYVAHGNIFMSPKLLRIWMSPVCSDILICLTCMVYSAELLASCQS